MRDQWTTNSKGRKILARAKAKAPGKCAVVRCRNNPEHQRALCHSCKRAETRANNPLWAQWHDLKHRHTRRGIKGKDRPCCTFQEWLDFQATKPGPDYVVDRIDPLKGYTLDNMQWLTYADNATKGATFDKQAYAEHKRRRHHTGGDTEFISDDERRYLLDEAHPGADQTLVDAIARLTTDHPEEFNALTGDAGITFTPTDDEPF
jgi:hypothetical protein